ncbi:MAG: hypothetical protein E7649_03230 [Ruminococcaceae bacterium]|nr:hypothetical protein [Oscillospiraceae bacterium]
MARSKYKWRIFGFVVKALCGLFIAAVAGLLIWRIVDSSTDPRDMNTLIPNQKLCDAYEQNGGKLTMFDQEQTTHTRGDNNYGYFAVTQAVFIKEADQLQFVFRYNNSTLGHTKEDYSLPEQPSRDANVYDVTVTIMYDLTPENKDDNDGKTTEAVRYERFYPSDMKSAQKTLYNYRKFVFDDIKITDDVIGVYADFYYMGDIDYSKEPYGSLLLYYCGDKNRPITLTANDKKAIEAFN